MNLFFPCAIALLIAAPLFGQAPGDKAKPPIAPKVPPSPTGISTGLPFYAVDDAMRLKIRDLEYKSDQLEIEIQRMKVKIEEDKAAEIAIWKEITKAAQEYAKDKNIDPDQFDFDAAEPNYVQKKHHDPKKD
jgi:hypothetical protein